jgi:hypothetical protein
MPPEPSGRMPAPRSACGHPFRWFDGSGLWPQIEFHEDVLVWISNLEGSLGAWRIIVKIVAVVSFCVAAAGDVRTPRTERAAGCRPNRQAGSLTHVWRMGTFYAGPMAGVVVAE